MEFLFSCIQSREIAEKAKKLLLQYISIVTQNMGVGTMGAVGVLMGAVGVTNGAVGVPKGVSAICMVG